MLAKPTAHPALPMVILIVLLVSGLALAARAATMERPASTLVPTASPSAAQRAEFDLIARQSEGALRTRRIAYLVGRNAVTEDHVAAPERFSAAFGAQIVHDRAGLAALMRDRPLDALIVHASALDEADSAQISAGFRAGTVLAFINLYRPEIDALLGTTCPHTPPDTWYPGNFFVIYHVELDGADPDRGQAIVNHLFGCGDSTIEPGGYSAGFSNENLDIWAGYPTFVSALANALRILG